MAYARTAVILLLSAVMCKSAYVPIPMQSWNIAPPPPPRYSILEDPVIDEDILNAFSTSTKSMAPPPPEVKSLHILSQISNRYANTVLNSRVVNPANVSQQVSFSVIIPETAFITGFQMEIEGKTYKAYVKEKEEAKKEYNEAVHRGQAAAHVHQSARDSERFSVSVNVEAQSKVTFTLTYEELLQRELGVYRHVININPGQIIPDLKVDVHIKEPRNITELHAKEIQSANEINPDVGENPNAQVEWIHPNEAKIHFEADEKEQRRIEKLRKANKEGSGLAGKFVIDYDVERDPTGNEVLVSDGYFVHFFAPQDLPTMRKHVLFVLDVSGSMVGRKIEQLQEAMLSILDQLKPEDHFNIIEFSYSVTVRNLDAEVNSAVYTPYMMYPYFGQEEFQSTTETPEKTESYPATPHYIERAKAIIRKMTAGGGTNIYDALKTAIKIAKNGVSTTAESTKVDNDLATTTATQTEEEPRPIIIFLTDGEPTVGETSLYKIQKAVNEFNTDPKSTIFSLAFGEGADFDFLKKISLANNGFARHIYEAADAQIQLRNFYNQISSPLLADVKFVYSPEQVDDQTVTKKRFSNLFRGSELVIAGKIGESFNSTEIEAVALDGPRRYQIPIPDERANKSQGFGSLERLWAYLTIRQLLDEDAIQSIKRDRYSYEMDGPTTVKPNSTQLTPKEKALKIALKGGWDGLKSCLETIIIWVQLILRFISHLLVDTNEVVYVETSVKERFELSLKDRALNLALKYSFVCPLTSLVVVKPNGTADLNTESASPGAEDGPNAPMAFQHSAMFAAAPGAPFKKSAYISHGSFPSYGQTSLKRMQSAPGSAGPSLQIKLHLDTSALGGGPASFAAFARPVPQMAGGQIFHSPPQPNIFYNKIVGYPGQSTTAHHYQPPPMATTLNVPTYDRVDFVAEDATAQSTESAISPPGLPSIPWLEAVRSGDQITLNTTQGLKTLNLNDDQNTTETTCMVKGVQGKCRALAHSATEDIPASLDAYINEYMCELQGLIAGVCVPEQASKSDEHSSTQEAITEVITEAEEVTDTPEERPTTNEAVEETITEQATTPQVENETETEGNSDTSDS